ncbi:tRNA glutamyl-Q(34) synthetase GluQRS [Paraburkholderia saeva]|uniref:Glutamyl-Q tRNA(Asp) synthetase n=1 Tax=Paraburkholderia saeva TaxID=2777537 RepID=A0A9N8WZX8_9BURK|nr:tRNA glutamyl-Q(34) synthetase GluQRS [Paraburkholderia saeva]CAG4888679.1 Glutamyl-Q tRNA(Asp) synthetase [Paraburkholderia saeva]CAG4899988.1 Glutamyl-Q tRNA(Asp) synthetase [Paraburkholderia saeva]CAG4912206.1 Glutamyl-Q tRNA(Asp) synthetase [Paraburkholderia saeva]
MTALEVPATTNGAQRPAYRGRFAPSPTGPLHFGSLVSALASWLDARAHGGAWLIRIEDVDAPRTVPGAAEDILATLARFGMHPDEPPAWQSQRAGRYQQALDQLEHDGFVYPCGCTRREIADSLAHAHARNTTLAYPGTCRSGLRGKPARAWRLRVPDGDAAIITFNDVWQGPQTQNLATEVGDFVLKRADGQWAYQLAVVADDADAGITHIVRGADLLDSTARQIFLQRCMGVPTPVYLHVPVVTNELGEKLSKQTGATPLDADNPLAALLAAAAHLGLKLGSRTPGGSLDTFYQNATRAWSERLAQPGTGEVRETGGTHELP